MADSRKRNMPMKFDGHHQNKKKFDFTNISGFRFLIPSKAAGTMIGKGGDVIKSLRSKFNCRIIIPDSQGPERLVIMDGEPDVVIDCWDHVLPTIKESVNAKECDFKNSGNKQIDDENEIDLRFVVHESQAGVLIGKGGERIRQLIDAHKMTIIKVYQTLCPHSTDRVVRLVSTQPNLLECLKNMLKLLENQIIKGIRSDYDPDNYDESAAPNYGGFISKDFRYPPRNNGHNSSVGYRANDEYASRSNVFDRVNKFDDNAVRSAFFGGSNSRNPIELLDGMIRMSSSSNEQSRHMSRVAIPVHLVSAVIGTDGHRLADIKRDSGAHVQLDEAPLNDREELFLIRGTADQIYKAQCLIQLCARKYGEMNVYGF